MVPYATGRFRRGALVRGFGHEDDDRAMERVGFRAVRRACQEFYACGECERGRLLGLTPLLNDPDPNIRVMAAVCLVLFVPEKALPVLEELDNYGPSKVSIQAMIYLRQYRDGQMRWISGLE